MSLFDGVGQAATSTWATIRESSLQILLSVLGGMIVVAIADRLRRMSISWRRRKLLKVFGRDAGNDSGVHIVYTHFVLPPIKDEKGAFVTHPYRKPGMQNVGAFSTSRPVSSAEVRAIKYLSEALGIGSGRSTKLSSDYEIREQLDLSFISIGGPLGNSKTSDAVYNSGNQLLALRKEDDFFTSRKSGRRIAVGAEPDYDYGLIMKCRPSQFPQRVWLVCAGLGEWGSSGAAWYLANKWEQIYRRVRSKEFAMVVKVKIDQDQSAEPVACADSVESAEQLTESEEE